MNFNKYMKIIIASDHGGFTAKEIIFKHLTSQGHSVSDIGCHTEESVDYPSFSHLLCSRLESYDLGILICGSGQGMAMSANKHKGVRAALCWSKDIAKLSREHNNANVLCLPGRFLTSDELVEIVDTFLSTQFEGGRHEKRVSKIDI
jgi:ribose 5-phosphate isomerase B